jgi:hypothetical protein
MRTEMRMALGSRPIRPVGAGHQAPGTEAVCHHRDPVPDRPIGIGSVRRLGEKSGQLPDNVREPSQRRDVLLPGREGPGIERIVSKVTRAALMAMAVGAGAPLLGSAEDFVGDSSEEGSQPAATSASGPSPWRVLRDPDPNQRTQVSALSVRGGLP